ncbi:MAG: ferrochelatase [Woeseiaceae bacterium]|nr:ferrochelatase [Woeseiaceae bacterium]
MPKYRSTPQFEHGLSQSTGVLVVNLGTPDAPTAGAVRRFLRQFLSDPRVVEYPRLLWWLILNLVILPIRPSRSAAAYRKIWTDQGSPLLLHSQTIANKLRDRLGSATDTPILVELAMTYGRPSVAAAIEKLLASGARRIITLPLYPQYSGTTTAPVFDVVVRELGKQRWIPESRFINDYHDAPAYVGALTRSVRDSWEKNGRGDKLLMSFHGVPKQTLIDGDPYHCQCRKTARLLEESLGLSDTEWAISFQSRVGREEWLAPYTDVTVKGFGQQGLSRLDVICPGFSTDCLETLEEIEMQNAEFFLAAGGGSLHYIPSLNARDDHVDFLATLIAQHNSGWSANNDPAARRSTRERAVAMGAHS